jgi:hypothetical protein
MDHLARLITTSSHIECCLASYFVTWSPFVAPHSLVGRMPGFRSYGRT